MTEKKKMTS